MDDNKTADDNKTPTEQENASNDTNQVAEPTVNNEVTEAPASNEAPDVPVNNEVAEEPASPETPSQPTIEPATPTPVAPAAMPVTPAPKKSSKLRLVLLVVLLLVVAGAAAYYFTTQKAEAPAVETTESTSNANESQAVGFVIAKTFDDRVTLEELDQDTGGVVVFNQETGRYIMLEPLKEGKFNANVTQKDPSNPVTADELRQYYVDSFTSQGFVVYQETSTDLNQQDSSEGIVRLKKDNTICTVQVSGTTDPAGTLYVTCADLSTLAKTSAEMEEFYAAYEKYKSENDSSGGSYPYVLTVDKSKVQKSEFEGYSYLYGGIGGFGGGAGTVFVKQGDGNWVFFTGRQAMNSCTDYDTELFQKALAHETCYDDTAKTETTVKEYYNL